MKYEFWDDFIVEGTKDYVGIWQIVYRFELEFPEANPKEIRLITIKAVREILETGLMQIGMFEYVDEKNLEFQISNMELRC